MLLAELEKPRSQQRLTVDHVLEATKAAEALRKKSIINVEKEDDLRSAIIEKFKNDTIKNTVAPRQLIKVARAVERGDVSKAIANKITNRLISEPKFTIDDAFEISAQQADFQHNTEQIAERTYKAVTEHIDNGYRPSDELRRILEKLSKAINRLLKS